MISRTAVNVGAITPMPEDWERILCVAAHPGDVEYGVASAVARWTAQRKQVTYLLVTRGEAGIDGMLPLAILDAARDAGNRWIFPELLDDGFEPWPGVRYVCFAGAQQPTHGVDVTDHLDRGIASLQAHAGYLKGLGAAAIDPAEFLTWNAVASGERMGVDAAVLLDVCTLIPDHVPSWAASRRRSR